VYLVAFGEYALRFLGVPLIISMPVAALLLAALNVYGAQSSSRFQIAVTAGVLAVLGFFVVAGALHLNPSNWSPFFPNSGVNTLKMAGMLLITFLGFELVSNVAGEVKKPDKTIPKAFVASMVLVLVVYFLVSLVLTGVVNYEELGVTSMIDASKKISGSLGVSILSLAALMATVTSFNGSIVAASRVAFAMAKDGFLVNKLGEVWGREKTPLYAILVTLALILLGSALGIIELLAYVTNGLFLFVFILINVSVILLRVSRPEEKRPFKVPFFPVVPVAAILFDVLLFVSIDFRSLLAVAGIFSSGLTVFFLRKHWKAKKKKPRIRLG
jgi:amino acid transporter